jgi:hypothetical protein
MILFRPEQTQLMIQKLKSNEVFDKKLDPNNIFASLNFVPPYVSLAKNLKGRYHLTMAIYLNNKFLNK